LKSLLYATMYKLYLTPIVSLFLMKEHKNYLEQRKKDKRHKIYVFVTVIFVYVLVAGVVYIFHDLF